MSKDSETHDEGRALVVIGSSAGGIEALSVLVSTLPANFPAPVVLACFGHADRFHPRNDIYAALADRCTLVGVLGVGMDPDPSFRVRCTPIPERDPLAQEWVVAVVGHGVSEVVAARSLGTDRGGLNGTVEVIETSDRQEVLDVAHLLMNRVVPARKR